MIEGIHIVLILAAIIVALIVIMILASCGMHNVKMVNRFIKNRRLESSLRKQMNILTNEEANTQHDDVNTPQEPTVEHISEQTAVKILAHSGISTTASSHDLYSSTQGSMESGISPPNFHFQEGNIWSDKDVAPRTMGASPRNDDNFSVKYKKWTADTKM